MAHGLDQDTLDMVLDSIRMYADGRLQDKVLLELDAEDRFRERLLNARTQDGEIGGAAAGPHRSDMTVWHLAHGMPAAQCSWNMRQASASSRIDCSRL